MTGVVKLGVDRHYYATDHYDYIGKAVDCEVCARLQTTIAIQMLCVVTCVVTCVLQCVLQY